MTKLSEFYSRRTRREVTFIMITLSIIFLITAFSIGIEDNFPGILFLYVGIITLGVAFTHHWREKRKFKFLRIFSLLSIPVFAVMHELLEALNKTLENSTIISNIAGYLSTISFFLVLFFCPVGLLIGMRLIKRIQMNHTFQKKI